MWSKWCILSFARSLLGQLKPEIFFFNLECYLTQHKENCDIDRKTDLQAKPWNVLVATFTFDVRHIMVVWAVCGFLLKREEIWILADHFSFQQLLCVYISLLMQFSSFKINSSLVQNQKSNSGLDHATLDVLPKSWFGSVFSQLQGLI